MAIRLILVLWSIIAVSGEAETAREQPRVAAFAGSSKNPITGHPIKVPFDAPSVRFSVKPVMIRARFKLEGLDQDWRERSDHMAFMVRFLNKSGDQILQRIFPTKGNQAGWHGSVERSKFGLRREEIKVPDAAEYVSVTISSAGPPDAVGVFAVTGVTITTAEGGDKRMLLDDGHVPGEAQSPWLRGGTHPSMATSTVIDGASGESPVMIITDDDLAAHAEWATRADALPQVKAGEVLDVTWKESYNIAVGGPHFANYERLRPGDYRFVVEDLTVDGGRVGTIRAVELKVASPYWEKFWFWATCVTLVAALSIVVARKIVQQKIRRHLKNSQLIADERLRIARDLHDDLGTRLSHISLLAGHSENAVADSEFARSALHEIAGMSKELIGALSETVWMLNPRNNDLDSLVDFLCRIVSELCRLADIRCRIDAMSVDQSLEIGHDLRHNVTLAVKEAVNNALRHAHASEIRLRIRLDGNVLNIAVIDNGTGLVGAAARRGTGLASIADRMAAVSGKHAIRHLDEGGLEVSLEVPIR